MPTYCINVSRTVLYVQQHLMPNRSVQTSESALVVFDMTKLPINLLEILFLLRNFLSFVFDIFVLQKNIEKTLHEFSLN